MLPDKKNIKNIVGETQEEHKSIVGETLYLPM